jgi:diaminopimelate epimerase
MTLKTIPFTKMQGAGNDFIVIEAAKGISYCKLAEEICDRTFGIGADGLLVLDCSRKANYKMQIINADGSEAEMCGNGARCMAAYISHHRKPTTKLFTMETLAGIINAEVSDKTVTVRLSDPKDYKADIPLNVLGRNIQVQFINTGVPHCVVYVDNLAGIDVALIGRAIRTHKHFAPAGTNVNFVEQIKPDHVAVRTFERGVENETKACGTGSVAAAIVSYLAAHPQTTNQLKAKMSVLTRSTEVLQVIFDIVNHHPQNVWLKGSATFIAQGFYFLKAK